MVTPKIKRRLECGSEIIPIAVTDDELRLIVDLLGDRQDEMREDLSEADGSAEEREYAHEKYKEVSDLHGRLNRSLRDHYCCCVDCSVNTSYIEEYYNVLDHVWAETGLRPDDGMLCIRCLEARIGRKLTPADFSDAPVNQGFFGLSDTFKDRLGLKA